MNAYKSFESLNHRCKDIFYIIQKDGPITKSGLINKTQMKLSTLNREVKILIDNKMVVETSTAESTGGRKPVLYDVNPNEFYIIGIDISRTYIQIVIINLKINIVVEKIINNLYNNIDITESLQKCINNLCNNAKIDNSMIVGIGIGIVPGAGMEALYDKLISEFQVPVYIDNGENTAVVGEYFFGLGKGKQNIAYINCGAGIRTGLVSSGVLIRTINNSEDALAHMIVDVRGELCSCGNYGCVESYSSISKITQKFISEIKNEKAFLHKDLNKINYIDVCGLAESGNRNALTIIMDSALHFGIGLSNYIRLFNPQLIILSGPLVQHSQLFYDECKKIAIERCHIKNNKISFNRGGYFKNRSIAVGAAVMVVQKLINSK